MGTRAQLVPVGRGDGPRRFWVTVSDHECRLRTAVSLKCYSLTVTWASANLEVKPHSRPEDWVFAICISPSALQVIKSADKFENQHSGDVIFKLQCIHISWAIVEGSNVIQQAAVRLRKLHLNRPQLMPRLQIYASVWVIKLRDSRKPLEIPVRERWYPSWVFWRSAMNPLARGGLWGGNRPPRALMRKGRLD